MSSTRVSEVANGRAKKPAGEQDSENTPLLAHDDPEQGYRNDSNSQPTISEKTQGFFRKAGRWLLKNRMVAAIITLLLGGFIALCVYVGGM